MKRRYMFVLMMTAALLLLTAAPALAGPAAPPQPPRRPAIHIGVAWGAIVQDQAGAHNFVRPAPEEPPVLTGMPGTAVRLTAGASGLWMGEAGGTLSASLEVYAVDENGGMTLLADDDVSETKEGPAFKRHLLDVPVSFNEPGELHLLARLTATAEPRDGEPARDVDELEAVVIIFDPSTFGAISGRVTANDSGEGLEDLAVTAGNRELRVRRAARTDADGNYTIESLPAGDYLIEVRAQGSAYVGEFYDDAHSPDEATPVAVAESGETTSISFGLDRGAEITGRVSDANGNPLAGIPIVVRPTRTTEDTTIANLAPPRPASAPVDQRPPFGSAGPDPAPPGPGPAAPRPRPAAVTGDDGTYTVQGLPAGEYVVTAAGARRGYSVEFWQEASTPDEATPIAVELGQSVSDIDFTLELQPR